MIGRTQPLQLVGRYQVIRTRSVRSLNWKIIKARPILFAQELGATSKIVKLLQYGSAKL